ncbi:MAG: type II toxin-antitoxin system RelB/DinJ family antitoxin [candidate division SR1 bacterium]|nr:type II toxin-antitoxin system RelB/DinJ family antitoxin [candidate division SR1 bacterium]
MSKFTTKNLVVPIETHLKDEVKAILVRLGLNQSQVVSALYKEIARTKKVPLSFDLNDTREPDSEELVAINNFLARRKSENYNTHSLADVISEIETSKGKTK